MRSLYEPRFLDLSALAAPIPRGDDSFKRMAGALGRAAVAHVSAAYQAVASGPTCNAPLLKQEEFFERQDGWRPEIGIALERAARNQPVAAGVQLAIMLQVNGSGGTWSLDLPAPEWFLLGSELIRMEGRLTAGIEASGRFLHFSVGNRLIERVFPERTAEASIATDKLRSASNSSSLRLIDPRAAADASAWPLKEVPLRPLEDPSNVGIVTAAAFDILDRFAPEYAPWVRRSITTLMPVSCGENVAYSGSALYRPGWVAASFPMRPELLAEAFVHEASHQHFFLGSFCVSYCEQSLDAVYYSPIRQTERPLWVVLMAYHAVGNITLYYIRLLRNGYDPDGVCSRRFAYWTEMALEYESAFQRTDIPLTEAGRKMWMEVQTRVAAEQTDLISV